MLTWLVKSIMMYTVKRDVARDKTFQKKIADYDREIKRCTENIEASIKELEKTVGHPLKKW